MEWTLPGTVLQASVVEADQVQALFSSMFLSGGMVLSQVCSITGLESYTVQNWVKRALVPPPENKRYTMDQVCRVIVINMLKNVMPMEQICAFLPYINGKQDMQSLDDAQLYFLFVRLAAFYRLNKDLPQRRGYMQQLLSECPPECAERVKRVLGIMVTAHTASELRVEAEKMVQQLNL